MNDTDSGVAVSIRCFNAHLHGVQRNSTAAQCIDCHCPTLMAMVRRDGAEVFQRKMSAYLRTLPQQGPAGYVIHNISARIACGQHAPRLLRRNREIRYHYSKKHMISIQVPATSANMGPGFDSIGVALQLYNHLWVEEIPEGLEIEVRRKQPILVNRQYVRALRCDAVEHRRKQPRRMVKVHGNCHGFSPRVLIKRVYRKIKISLL